MVKFFINRPIFATVVALLIIIVGLIALNSLPVAQYPDITPPTVQVSATYVGADAQTVAQTIGTPIEQQVNGVEGMMYMNSTSSSSGSYNLTVTFEVGTDLDIATIMVQNRVAIAQSSLPEAVVVQGITTRKQSTNIVMILSLASTDPEYDALYLTNYATLNMLDELTRLPGVGSVSVMGAGDYSMRIWMDPEAMRIRNITPDDVYEAISAQSQQVSAGYVGQPIAAADNPFQYTLMVKGQLVSPEEFGNIILKTEEGGKFLRIKDVARVELGSESYNVISRLNGEQSATIAIYQLPGANSMDVAKVVKKKMKELSEGLPEEIDFGVSLDTTLVISASIHEVLITFLETTALVVLVIFLFLQNFRAVIIPCISIPVSLIGTLAVMSALGFSINTLTMFGMILAIAIVVDDAIVVVENASRLMETGKYNAREAVTAAMKELISPIIGIVLVLLSVFIPTIFIGGITGQLYKQFALTISAATLISGFNSLTLTPALCGLFLQIPKNSKFFLFRGFNVFYNGVQKLYNACVLFLLKKPWFAAISFIIVSALAFLMFLKWPSTFLPQEDDGYFLVSSQLPPAASLNRTEAINAEIDAILSSYPEVDNYVAVGGFSVMSDGETSNAGTYFVILKNWSERKGKAHTAQAVVDRFNRDAYGIQEAEIFGMVPPAIPGLGASGGLQLELQDRNNLGSLALQEAVDMLLVTYKTKPEIASLTCMYQANVPQYMININRDKVEMYGLNIDDVFSTLSYYMGAAYVNNFSEFGRNYQVNIEASENAQKQLADIMRLSVANSDNKMVPFASFIELEEQLGLDNINMYNMYRAASITCTPATSSSSSQAMLAMEALVQEQLGDNFGYQWTSIAYQEQQSGSKVILVFGMALLVVFLVLSAQYESWTSPLAAILGIPVALLGAMLGCLIMNVPVSIYTEIGIILLVALSAKNGILIVEFARDFRKAGNTIRDSAIEAGKVRLRPILMTSFAFVFGVMPLLFATGAGANSRIALGAAVVFGVAVNTLFATMFIPVFYDWFQNLEERVLDKVKFSGTQPVAQKGTTDTNSTTIAPTTTDSDSSASASTSDTASSKSTEEKS